MDSVEGRVTYLELTEETKRNVRWGTLALKTILLLLLGILFGTVVLIVLIAVMLTSGIVEVVMGQRRDHSIAGSRLLDHLLTFHLAKMLFARGGMIYHKQDRKICDYMRWKTT